MADDDDKAKARARVEAERQKVRDAEAEKALRKMASEGADMAVGNTDPPAPPPPVVEVPQNPVPGLTGLLGTGGGDPTAALGEPDPPLPAAAPHRGGDATATDSASAPEDREAANVLEQQGCSPSLARSLVAAGIFGLVVVTLAVLIGKNDSKSTSAGTSSATPAAEGAANPESPLDGHWVLVGGLQNTYLDMGLSCSQICDAPGRQQTIDKASVTIDISGAKVTGGTFKTGYSSTTGNPCEIFESRVDATAGGNVDQTKRYGQLIVDGSSTNITHCDSSSQQVVEKPTFHTSRFFFLKADTLVLCYNIDPNTFDACTTTGFSGVPPDKLGDGTAATFKRG